jgi:uncharacterized protein (UPF0305 family)
MTRKEEIINKSVEFVNNRYCDIGIKTTHEASVAACQDIAEWSDRTMIERACNFIKKRFTETIVGNVISRHETTINEVINDLRKAMMED